ncbi:MAG: imidazole glycerol phosphate synthase subunit HisH [Verrucomicrobiae bacterium]|nr:imidazole glycerol phosphate synthase subunit HisH [Verrucomicrobiae bacterium]
MPRIALIDYDIGNLRSAEKALQKVGATVVRATSPEMLQGVDGAVLPGVGAFRDCVKCLGEHRMTEAVGDFIRSDRPFLGICVGLQMLFETGHENGAHAGLGLLGGHVDRLRAEGLKVPQIGWNRVRMIRDGCPLFRGIADGSHFYFVHSYAVRPLQPDVVAAITEYGETYPSVVWRGNLYATQFHPEKSQQAGLTLLENFVSLCR